MPDKISVEQRSRIMSRIRSKNTKPEMLVRKHLSSRGYRYRLHDKKLPGKPDIVLPKYKSVIFVNGCFWHRHRGCKYAYNPKSKVKFWNQKFTQNIERQKEVTKQLRKLKWKVLVIWECEVNNEKIFKKI